VHLQDVQQGAAAGGGAAALDQVRLQFGVQMSAAQHRLELFHSKGLAGRKERAVDR
jgi:hypothetical protein